MKVEEDKRVPIERLTISQAREKYHIHKAFELMINDNPYQVWNIMDYEHENGKWNGTPATWWLDYSEPGEENVLVPYVDIGVHRICWEIRYKQKNYVKHKWGETDIRNSGRLDIYANGRNVYRMNCRNLEYAMSNAMIMPYKLMEHPFNFLKREEENGRKIWYYGLPATISINDYDSDIKVIPDYEKISSAKWWKLYNERKKPVNLDDSVKDPDGLDMKEFSGETHKYDSINHGDPLWDGMINWFRK